MLLAMFDTRNTLHRYGNMTGWGQSRRVSKREMTVGMRSKAAVDDLKRGDIGLVEAHLGQLGFCHFVDQRLNES
jgi:hypothetical protein